MAGDVFEEDPARADPADDAGDVRPEVAGVGRAPPVAGLAERLTGIAGRDEMNPAAPRAAVEGSQIVPYSRRSQGLVFHPGHERGRGVGFPLDVTHSSIAGLGDVQAEVKAAVPCAEGEAPNLGRGVGLGT